MVLLRRSHDHMMNCGFPTIGPKSISGLRIAMLQRVEVNPPNEHGLYLRLFITTSGGL